MRIELRKYLILNQQSLISKLGWNLPEKKSQVCLHATRLGKLP
jgi:hypothetical protein